MSRLLALDWNHDDVGGVEAEIGGGRVTVLRTFHLAWPEDHDVEARSAELGDWLKRELQAQGVEAEDTLIVLPREELVTRRLDLPEAPDNELPALVRFQAAAKSATPIDQLALDFIPLPRVEGEPGRPALLASIDRKQLDGLRSACTAAGLKLKSVQGSPFAVAEVAVRFEQQHGEDPNATTLVVFQDQHRVELAILQTLGLLFSHHTRLSANDDRSVKATMAEINRAVITLGQSMHTTIDVARVCLIHAGNVDTGLEQSLAERFGGKLQVIDPAEDRAVTVVRPNDSPSLAGLAPAIGVLLAEVQRNTPSVDFLNPRQPPKPKDLRKQRLMMIGGAAAALLLLVGAGAWAYSGSLSDQIRSLKIRERDLQQTLDNSEPTIEAHTAITTWRAASTEPLSELERLNRLLPGTDRLVLIDVQVAPGRNGGLAHVSGYGIAREERDITALFDRLVDGGYRASPPVLSVYKLDPDYPVRFTLDANRMPPPVDEKPDDPAP